MANVDAWALLTLVLAEVPDAGMGPADGPEVGTGGAAGGRGIAEPPGVRGAAGAEDIVWDVIYCRGAVSDSAHKKLQDRKGGRFLLQL